MIGKTLSLIAGATLAMVARPVWHPLINGQVPAERIAEAGSYSAHPTPPREPAVRATTRTEAVTNTAVSGVLTAGSQPNSAQAVPGSPQPEVTQVWTAFDNQAQATAFIDMVATLTAGELDLQAREIDEQRWVIVLLSANETVAREELQAFHDATGVAPPQEL
ncbi:hypothetical protein F0M18_13590 [Pseudohalioglobus sediminis]|uniref:SPOR domain-containing protein n=1 Tax=Pseudohalioglobus sediminis TaxID=2606449 RepID=A0A5B0WT39_9GAMM|nr:hypothetical protein [Pseudohalioglobus sediminis]KAA1190093.1 hypothetical protein F0M18_13590 [Pseudohalioglobus sediminis]